jgi:FtsP/CotA-like multicopper oxidase with cupredoxin domain
MNNPGVWVLGGVRKHVQASGMGVVIEYANSSGKPVCRRCRTISRRKNDRAGFFDSKFPGHGNEELWRINGPGYPQNSTPEHSLLLQAGQRNRLVMKNKSMDDHPIHLHRHTFEIRRLEDGAEIAGLRKDVVLVHAGGTVEVEFVADNPGKTLFHCHQQDHMDRGFMMVFNYA